MNEPQTAGISPKAIAASVTAYVAPIIVGWLATKVGVNVEVGTVTTFVGPLVLAGVTFVSAYLAKAGKVVEASWPDPHAGPNPPVK